jgi:Sel1 repeat
MHGTLAGVPEPLWRPLTRVTIGDKPFEHYRAAVYALDLTLAHSTIDPALDITFPNTSPPPRRLEVSSDNVTREWYEKAAAKGDVNAMTNLGVLYANGRGIAQDYKQAREWYGKAAAKGQTTAMTNLGVLYENGQGVAQDYAKAREWYGKAAAKGDVTAKANLERLSIREAAGTERYAEAVQLQEELAARVEAAETKRDGKPGEETAQELNELAWHALFARDFTKAMAVADRAHALLPDDLTIETNRAHALMFLGRGEEAKALYLGYKGKPVADNKLWERVVAEDFVELRKAGLTHPTMADIEKQFGRVTP